MDEPKKGDVVFVVDNNVGVKRTFISRVLKSEIVVEGNKYNKNLTNGKFYNRSSYGEYQMYNQFLGRAYLKQDDAEKFYTMKYWLKKRTDLSKILQECKDIQKIKQIYAILNSDVVSQGESNGDDNDSTK